MTLDEFLSRNEMTDERFGALIGRSQSAVNRLRRRLSTPSLGLIARISDATAGAVTAADFINEAQAKSRAKAA